MPRQSVSFSDEVSEKADVFRSHANVGDRKYRLKTYKNCFVAKEVIDALVKAKVVETREAAVEYGRSLEDAGVLEHVVDPHIHRFKDEYLFFKFKDKVTISVSPSPPASPSRGRSTERVPRASRAKKEHRCILDDDLVIPDDLDMSASQYSQSLDASSHHENNTNTNNTTKDAPKGNFWRSVTHAVTRSLSPMRSNTASRPRSDSPSARRKKDKNDNPLPHKPRQVQRTKTDDTTSDDEEEEEEEANTSTEIVKEQTWEEERFELKEKLEALESKLRAKESVLQSMITAAAKGTNTFPTRRSMAPLASMVMSKEKELADLEATVKKQLIRIEQLESQQEQQVKRRAELLFQEWQQEEQQLSVWEQLQEQNERIAQLEAENEYQRQLHQRSQAYNEKLIKQLLAEKKAWQEAESAEFVVGTAHPTVTTPF